MFNILISKVFLIVFIAINELTGVSSNVFDGDLLGIIGGEPVSNREAAWMARLGVRSSIKPINLQYWVCSGSLINKRWILTVAHCLQIEPYPYHSPLILDGVEIQMGIHQLKDNQTSREVLYSRPKDVFLHHGFNRSSNLNDIALIKLPYDLDFNGNQSHLSPIKLNNNKYDVDENNCHALGWGATNDDPGWSSVLNEVRLPILNDTQCKHNRNETVKYKSEYMICAGYENYGKSVCIGDSGGPLVCPLKDDSNHWIQYGITSYFSGCSEEFYSPSIFARVSHYIDWIEKVMRENSG